MTDKIAQRATDVHEEEEKYLRSSKKSNVKK